MNWTLNVKSKAEQTKLIIKRCEGKTKYLDGEK